MGKVFLSGRAKRAVVTEVLSGKMTKEHARRVYGIKGKSSILEWMRIFAGSPGKSPGLDPVPILKTVDMPSTEEERLRAEVGRLKEELKISQLKAKAYQAMVQTAREDYGIDLEKKRGAKQSKGSKK